LLQTRRISEAAPLVTEYAAKNPWNPHRDRALLRSLQGRHREAEELLKWESYRDALQ
jgi:hypothetical protein